MLTIRMRRVGAKKKPYFRVVVTDSRSARDGRALEVLGHYNPTAQPETLVLDRSRLQHWLERGAQPSDTVRTLLSRQPEPTPADTEVTAAPAETSGA
jgi:small subunit ribosomal protein S16